MVPDTTAAVRQIDSYFSSSRPSDRFAVHSKDWRIVAKGLRLDLLGLGEGELGDGEKR